ncbi:MAG: hypothetical protein DRN07_06195 [Thermoplasmata archaeon]|nr:MAG: hypothetical protein DRN07_06195 [Thermoplasmata archaeon]
MTFTLCKWNTIVGTVTIGGQPAAGYKLEAVRKDTLEVVDTDVTTAAGVFALENFSEDVGGYKINLYSPSDTLISTKDDIDVSGHCGATGVLTYTDGVWTLTGF